MKPTRRQHSPEELSRPQQEVAALAVSNFLGLAASIGAADFAAVQATLDRLGWPRLHLFMDDSNAHKADRWRAYILDTCEQVAALMREGGASRGAS